MNCPNCETRIRSATARLITAREAAAILRVSERTIWRYVADGEFVEPIRFGHCTRFDQAAYLAYSM